MSLYNLIDDNPEAFPYISQGCFGTVYGVESRPNIVIKHSRKIIDGYLDYVDYCLQHQGEPLIPKIHSVIMGQDEYVVILDRLEETSSYRAMSTPSSASRFDRALGATGYSADDYKRVIRYYGSKEQRQLVKKLKELYPHQFLDIHGDNWMYSGNDELFLTDPFSRDCTSYNKLKDAYSGTKPDILREYIN